MNAGPVSSYAGEGATAYWCEWAVLGPDPVRDSATALAGDGVIASVLITIADGRIASIEIGADPPRGASRLRGLTLPGLADVHGHAFHRALRSRTQRGSGSFWTWRDAMYRAAERLDPDRYHRLARAAFAEMASAGVAVAGEFHYLHHGPDGKPYREPNAMAAALFSAADEAGIRITLLDTLYLHGGIELEARGRGGSMLPPVGTQRRFTDGAAEHWVERIETLVPTDTHRIGAAVHSVRAVDPSAIAIAATWAEERAAPLHAHVSEQVAENEQCAAIHGATPVGLLHESGALGARFTAVHATHLTAEDIRMLSESGSAVCMCPTTERDLGDGIGPTGEFAAAGIPISLGSDSHAVIDMFEEARSVELHERLRARVRGVHDARSLLAMATVNGHRSLGWDDAGTIAVGGRADLVTVRLDSVRTAGASPHASPDSALEAAIFAATAHDVTDVVVDGHPIVVDGRHATIDVETDLHSAISELMDD